MPAASPDDMDVLTDRGAVLTSEPEKACQGDLFSRQIGCRCDYSISHYQTSFANGI